MVCTPSQFSLRCLLLTVGAVSVFIAGTRFVYVEYHRAVAGHEAFHAVWQTHDMLIHHMSQNEGKWPSDWAELESSFACTNPGYGAPDTAWLRDRVLVDFTFDPTALAQRADFRQQLPGVLFLADGSSNAETQAANQRITRFVQSRPFSDVPRKGAER
jgi:hypothetical protein